MRTYYFSLTRLLAVGCTTWAVAACKKDPQPAKPLAYTTVTTLAGCGIDGWQDGAGPMAAFSAPEGIAVDGQGNVFVADNGNNRIRKITPDGTVSTYAGTGASGLVNGSVATAQFKGPLDVALDGAGNLFVVEHGTSCVRKITPSGSVSTVAGSGVAGFADGPAATAQFNGPAGIAVDAQGTLYVADWGNSRIRKITPTGVVSTLAGNGVRGYADGPGANAQFNMPEGMVLDKQNVLYVAEFGGQRIRKILPNGTVSTVAGTGVGGYADGPAATAQFYSPAGLTIDAAGNLYVAESANQCIRRITPSGHVSRLAGTQTQGLADGPVHMAQFTTPSAITIDGSGTLYVTEFSHRIRKITAN